MSREDYDEYGMPFDSKLDRPVLKRRKRMSVSVSNYEAWAWGIDFECPNCGEEIICDIEADDMTLVCPHCDVLLDIELD